MTETNHFRASGKMYVAAPINKIFDPQIVISKGCAEIEVELFEQYHHSGAPVHGSVY